MASDILSTEILLEAYRSGAFPMAEDRNSSELFWVNPQERGVVPLDRFHISRSLARQLRKEQHQIKINHDFDAVIAGCAARDDTWISADIQRAYRRLFEIGHVHTTEVYDGTRLVGGVYGVSIGAAYFGESMFSCTTSASKIALAYLVDRLRLAGFQLFDTQFITPHLASLGAIEISRDTYLAALSVALSQPADFTAPAVPPRAHDIIQRNTQTS
jgi:leucyl/phenylalanyl-tRNA--protein transferase